MAKTIKFNLICDDKPVRTIEDLQNNFSIEDVLEYYNNKLLHRWLEVRGYSDELKKVSAITYKEPIKIIKELIKIFNVVSDEKKVEESVYMLQYLEERKILYNSYCKLSYTVKSITNDYEFGYRRLAEDILNNPNDIAKIKANINEIVTNYKWIFKLNHRNLFYVLMEKSKLAIMCLLMNEEARKYYLPFTKKDSVAEFNNTDRNIMFQQICSMITTLDFRTKLGDNLISFAGVTNGYWKDLEPKEKKYMIISMESGDFVRSAGKLGGELSYTDIKNKFVILDGIDYKSNSSTHNLLYMEV